MFSFSKFLPCLVLIIGFCGDVGGDGSFVVTHAPDYIKFNPSAGNIALRDIPSYLTSVYGFSPHKELSWSGIEESSLFQRPQATVLLIVEGIDVPLSVKTAASFRVDNDDSELNLEPTINQLHSVPSQQESLLVDFSKDNNIFDVQASYPSLFDSISSTLEQVKRLFKEGQGSVLLNELGTLDLRKQNDLHFVAELQVILEIVEVVSTKGDRSSSSAPDFFHFRLTGLRPLADEYGRDSQQFADAMKLLSSGVNKITETFKKIYAGNVVVHVAAFTTGAGMKLRVARSLMETATVLPTGNPIIDYGRAGDYPNDYGVIFNLCLWTSVALVIIIIAICVAFGNLDPGRDSIIYRMTAQRLKKE